MSIWIKYQFAPAIGAFETDYLHDFLLIFLYGYTSLSFLHLFLQKSYGLDFPHSLQNFPVFFCPQLQIHAPVWRDVPHSLQNFLHSSVHSCRSRYPAHSVHDVLSLPPAASAGSGSSAADWPLTWKLPYCRPSVRPSAFP